MFETRPRFSATLCLKHKKTRIPMKDAGLIKAHSHVAIIGAADGTRTRDPRRDRPVF